ncbi:hypothetical protein E4N62_15320 [Streptomyces sp. MNU76]|uniref:hypothetical protein n=1 Tax=Streptomyces sp. MNU76 TaxID=2560026 RepID=UPI001E35A777|nr:hypothetical protein [Streptomyces sp. MNU76]MCC9706520.1 hypothetical protein [Streptomyces sp. MNU76]
MAEVGFILVLSAIGLAVAIGVVRNSRRRGRRGSWWADKGSSSSSSSSGSSCGSGASCGGGSSCGGGGGCGGGS